MQEERSRNEETSLSQRKDHRCYNPLQSLEALLPYMDPQKDAYLNIYPKQLPKGGIPRKKEVQQQPISSQTVHLEKQNPVVELLKKKQSRQPGTYFRFSPTEYAQQTNVKSRRRYTTSPADSSSNDSNVNNNILSTVSISNLLPSSSRSPMASPYAPLLEPKPFQPYVDTSTVLIKNEIYVENSHITDSQTIMSVETRPDKQNTDFLIRKDQK